MTWSNIRIECPDGMPHTTKVVDTESGNPIQGVTRVEFSIQNLEPARVVLTIEGLVFSYEGKAELAGEVMEVAQALRDLGHFPSPIEGAALRDAIRAHADRLEDLLGRAVGLNRQPDPLSR